MVQYNLFLKKGSDLKHEANSSLTENAIKIERFYRKYKLLFYFVILAFIVWGCSVYLYQAYTDKELKYANTLFTKLSSKKTKAGLEELAKANQNLYTLLLISSNDAKAYPSIKQKDLNPTLLQLLKYKEGKPSIFLQNYEYALKGFKLLEKNDFKQAKLEFDKVDMSSSIYPIINSLKHYQDLK